MSQLHDDWDQETNVATVSGRILLAGTGFLVSATIWALLGFVQGVKGNNELALLDLALVLAHFVVGGLILRRLRIGWVLGLALAVVSIAACVLNSYYLAVIADGVSGLLLYFSHGELLRGSSPTEVGDH